MTFDERLRRDAIEALKGMAIADHDGIGVIVEGPVLTVVGEVQGSVEKYLVEQALLRIPNLAALVVRLDIAGHGSLRLDDQQLAEKLLQVLHADPAFTSPTFTVKVANGHVSLEGSAVCNDERTRVTKLLENVPGVKSLKNFIRVESPATRHDPALQMQRSLAPYKQPTLPLRLLRNSKHLTPHSYQRATSTLAR